MATLATPIPASANVQYYSILFQGYSPDRLLGDTVLLYGYNFIVSPRRAPGLAPAPSPPPGNSCCRPAPINGPYGADSSQYFSSATIRPRPNQAIVQGGDSGSPAFIVYGGQLYLAGGHYLLDYGSGQR